MNLPNKLTLSRLLIALVIFALLQGILIEDRSDDRSRVPALATAALALFLLAAITDSLDGYLARRAKLATAFGRVADPLMDKIIICGMLLFFLQIEATEDIVAAWMVVLILVREFLVTGLRGFMESRSHDFGAALLGKAKMVLQCAAVAFALAHIGYFQGEAWSGTTLSLLVWLTVIATAVSGVQYIARASAILREAKDI
jgi:CDP-diacylglycerol--glycerol-3-phosphate 3-phosphatidyltransferase